MLFFQKDKLPGKQEILEQSYTEPIQTETNTNSFEVEKAGISYTITPLYNYDLYGLVVSYHHSSAFWDYYHKLWKDYLNSADIGVVWGENIATEVYEKIKFTSGSWTLNYSLKPGTNNEVWSMLKTTCLSNNHILPCSNEINKTILAIRAGDQIYIKGYLVEYSHSGEANKRRSSTIRTDNGCEVIYVTDVNILKKANLFWRLIYSVSKYTIWACIIISIIFFIKDPY